MFSLCPKACCNLLHKQVTSPVNNNEKDYSKLEFIRKDDWIWGKNQDNQDPKFIGAQVQKAIGNRMLLLKINCHFQRVNWDQCRKNLEQESYKFSLSDWWMVPEVKQQAFNISTEPTAMRSTIKPCNKNHFPCENYE